MQFRMICLALQSVRKHLSQRSSGATMLWIIVSIVAIGGIGAAIALMSPSAMQSKLAQEAGERAYYNAMSGLNFIVSSEDVSESGNINYSNFYNAMGGGAMKTYTLPQGGTFAFQLNTVNTSGANGNYVISNLIGYGDPVGGASPYAYAMYGGSKGASGARSYSIGSASNPNGYSKYVLAGQSVETTSHMTIDGSIYSRTAIYISTHNTVTGSLVSNGTVSLEDHVTIGGSICADGVVSVGSDNIISGDINAAGDVTIGSTSKVSSIVSGGKVVLAGSSQEVHGDIDAAGDVVITSGAKVYGSIRSGGKVEIKSASCLVTGNIHAGGGGVTIGSSSEIGGSVYAAGNVELSASGAVVKGSVNASGASSTVTLKSGSKVLIDIKATGDVSLASSGCLVGGAINSGGQVSISDGCVVVGNVYAFSNVKFPGDGEVSGSVYSGGSITLSAWTSCVKGAASAKGGISSCSGTSCSSGNCYIGGVRSPNQSSIPTPSAPVGPDAPVSYIPCTIEEMPDPPKQILTTDGSKTGKNWSFLGKSYYYSKIIGDYGNIIKLDLSGDDIQIFSTGTTKVVLGGDTKIQVSTDGSTYKPMSEVNKEYARKVYLEANGSIELAWGADWFGTLFSRGSIIFKGGNTIIGSYASQKNEVDVTSGSGYTVTYVPSNYAIENW